MSRLAGSRWSFPARLALAAALSLVLPARLAIAEEPEKAAPPKAPAADQAPPSVGQTLDRQLSIVEGDLVPLVSAMPEAKLDFVPSGEGFKGVRSFRQQVGHVAAALHVFSAIVLGEDPAAFQAVEQNGPSNLKTRDDYVGYLKAAFAHAHKACASVNEKNQLEPVSLGKNFRSTRLGFTNLLTWHSFDHYGQLVVYLRLNGIVPPASRSS